MTAICTLPIAIERMEEWTKSDDEWIGRAGWSLLANIAIKNKMLQDDFFSPYLEEIKVNIHNEKIEKEAMNRALIAIGIRNEDLERLAIEIAREIGKVQVDRGETSCKTPDAEPYIKKREKKRKRNKKRGTVMKAMEAAQSIITSQFPNCDVALLEEALQEGSDKTSDLDIVIIDCSLPSCYRESFYSNGWPVEVFVHNFETLKPF